VPDVLSIVGTSAAQEGSSGGGIADANGGILGIITTSATQGAVADRTLYAITARHLRDTFKEDMGKELDAYLSSNTITTLIANFAAEKETLQKVLTDSLGN
jgi:hypothetical protein